MKVFYHDDPDGQCSAAIIKKAIGNIKDSEFVPITNHDVFPYEDVKTCEEVFIVDYTPRKEWMQSLANITQNITWIDHHGRSIEKYGDYGLWIQGKRDYRYAACYLTWQFFFPKDPMPMVVQMIADYDTWTFEFGDDTRRLIAGLETAETHPGSKNWLSWLDYLHLPTTIMKRGKGVLDFKRLKNRQLVDSHAYQAYLKIKDKEFFALVCNAPNTGSDLFESVEDRGQYDLFVRFSFEKDQYRVQLTTEKDDVDVSLIAETFGGGGHRAAAGFRSNQLPF